MPAMLHITSLLIGELKNFRVMCSSSSSSAALHYTKVIPLPAGNSLAGTVMLQDTSCA